MTDLTPAVVTVDSPEGLDSGTTTPHGQTEGLTPGTHISGLTLPVAPASPAVPQWSHP